MKKLIMAVCSILLSLAVATPLLAKDCNKGGRHGMCDETKKHDAFFAKLNPTPAQKAQIKTMREAFLRETKPLKDQIFSKRGDLKLLWLETNPDKNKIMALQKEIRAIRDQIEDKALSQRLDILNIMTPEQKEKIKAAWAEKRTKHEHGTGDGGNCGGCADTLDD